MIEIRCPIEGDIKPLKNSIFTINLERGERKKGSLFIPDDNMRARGIRARWCQVYRVGEGVKDLKPSQWILIRHGHWSRTMKLFDKTSKEIDVQVIIPKNVKHGILAVQDNVPQEAIDYGLTPYEYQQR